MTRKEAFEKFLSSNGSKLYLKCSVVMTIYKAVCLTAILVMLFAVLRFSGQNIIFCIAVAAALLSSWLLFKSCRSLISHIGGKETTLLKTIQTIHLGVGINLLYTPFMCMLFCNLMSALDMGTTKQVNITYDYQTFRMVWEIFGLISLACAISKLMSCRSVERHITHDGGLFLPFLLAEIFSILQSGMLIFIIIYFRPTLAGGVIMRLMFIPIILYYLASAVFFVGYIKFICDNHLTGLKKKSAEKDKTE